ncbi:NADPH-dependent aldehyde reductase 1, chloroplastic [Glycine max]|nr:NADPH-dependent aldehyde reductase 1, chloroplastic [Glycine max]
MASGENQFPPQKQYTQPGKEYLMNPPPQYSSPDYNPSNQLQGKIAVVTGGDSGIGRAVCNLFSLEGATVIFTYVKGQEDRDASDTLEIIKKAKTEDAKDPLAIPVDLGYEENCKRVVDEVINAYGRIDILVNNAAVQYERDSLEEIDDATLERWSLALQLVSKGIRVNGVAPGPIWTPLQIASLRVEEIVGLGSDTTAMKRAGQPIEVAPSYVFLASNLCSSYITGQVLHPNGGIIVNT